MPGLPAGGDPREKRFTDWEVLCIVSRHIFYHKLKMTTRAAHNAYKRFWRVPIPYEKLGFADVDSYFKSVKALVVSRNDINGQLEIMAEEKHGVEELLKLQDEFLPGLIEFL